MIRGQDDPLVFQPRGSEVQEQAARESGRFQVVDDLGMFPGSQFGQGLEFYLSFRVTKNAKNAIRVPDRATTFLNPKCGMN
jgi:hypothetical protein